MGTYPLFPFHAARKAVEELRRHRANLGRGLRKDRPTLDRIAAPQAATIRCSNDRREAWTQTGVAVSRRSWIAASSTFFGGGVTLSAGIKHPNRGAHRTRA